MEVGAGGHFGGTILLFGPIKSVERGHLRNTTSSEKTAGNGVEDEAGDAGGPVGKALLVASPFVFLFLFLLLEVWIRGRF